jgi:dTDP-4-amino-4,6-dideoxygalactose transaminase
MPVDQIGLAADIPAVLELARRHGLRVVEDAAPSLGATVGEARVGSMADFTCFSFHPRKSITTGEGGIITTGSADIADRLRLLRQHGQRVRYRHELLGYNYRLTDLQAAIGLVQLDHLEEWTEQRIENAAYLTSRLQGVITPTTLPGYRHVYHQYTIRAPHGRDVVARRLADSGVGTGVHYPIPVHRQPLYRQLGYRDDLPCAERASREVLSLPIHPSVTPRELDIVGEHVSSILARLAPRPV